jgi:hypothetical protein
MVGFRIPDRARTELDLAAWPKGATLLCPFRGTGGAREGFASRHRNG